MSNKDALQRYEPELPNPWYGRAAVVGILADAHAHYEAQVRQLGGLARPDAQPPTDRALQLMRLVEQYGGAMALIAACQEDDDSAGAAAMAAGLSNRINALAQEMSADTEMLDWLMANFARLVQRHDGGPVYVHAWVDGREVHGPDAGTPREAIRAAMKEQQR